MTLQIINCAQNSEAWLQARLGLPTASAFSKILAKGEGKLRNTYMKQLAGEIITGKPDPSWGGNEDTERGHELEAAVRDLYAKKTGTELIDMIEVGFVTDGKKGCSPDRLIGDEGGLEIKTTFPHYLADILLEDQVPTKHLAQLQGSMWITGRRWWDIAIYWPGMPLFVKRVARDEVYIQKLATEVDRFTAELKAVVAKLTAMDTARAA